MKKILFILLILFSLNFSAYGQAPSPSELSNPEHNDLKIFVQWMRAKQYAENVISKWVQDYMNDDFYELIRQEFTRYGPPETNPDPVEITYIELIPTDENAEANPSTKEQIEDLFKAVFGIKVIVYYESFPLSYIDTFGPYKVDAYGEVRFDYKIVGKWVQEHFIPPDAYYQGVIRFAIDSIDGMKVSKYGLRNTSSTYAVVSNELPVKEGASSHSHEWLHTQGNSHHFPAGGGKSYGTNSPMTAACTCDPYLQYLNKREMIGPLEAFLIEKDKKIDYPELVLGKAYSDHLISLNPCEFPFTDAPDPSVSLSSSFKKIIVERTGKTALQLDITASNDGNIPLSFVPIKTIVKAQCVSSGMTAVVVSNQEKTWNWADISQKNNFTFQLPLGNPKDRCTYTATTSVPTMSIGGASSIAKFTYK